MPENFENYKVFYFIGKHLNITKAANELFLSQPTVSKEIHEFENALGCKLFARTSRGVRLTPEGKLLYDRIAPAVEELIQAEMMIKRLGRHDEGVISIGVNRGVTSVLLKPFLDAFKLLHPRLDIVYTIAFRNVLDAMLERELVDIAFCYRPHPDKGSFTRAEFETKHHPVFPWQPEVEIYRLLTGNYMVVTRREMMKRFPSGAVCAADLYDYPLVLQVDHELELEKKLIHLLRRDGKLTARDHVIGDANSSIEFCLLTDCVGVVNELTVVNELEQGKLVPLYLEEPLPQLELIMFHSGKIPLRWSVRELKDYLMKQKAFDVKYVTADDKFQEIHDKGWK